MSVMDAIERRLEVREFADEPVAAGIERAVVNAARLSPSSKNRQDWHFLLVDGDALDDLAAVSPTGGWVADAAFAVIVCTGDYPSHEVDVGRAVTHMQFAAWEHGLGSCIYTGLDPGAGSDVFDIPDDYVVGAVLGVGSPAEPSEGTKDRRPFDEVVSHDRFGETM